VARQARKSVMAVCAVDHCLTATRVRALTVFACNRALHQNNFTGDLDIDSIGQLGGMFFLGLQRNRLSGSIPEWLGTLTSLAVLYVKAPVILALAARR
jgi:hypothetical protein